MRGNTISIELPLKRGKVSKTIPLYQYDYGQKLIITGAELPEYYEVHFSNEMHGDAVTSIGDSTGVLIPDALLATGENVYLWLYLHADSDDGETEFQGAIPVIKRAQVTDQTPTPAEQSVITQAIAALTAASAEATEAKEGAEAAQQHIENMGVAATTLPTDSDATVTKTVNSSGEVTLTFGLPRGVKGDRGDRGLQGETGNAGEDGADGFSPVVSLTKSGKVTTFSVTDAEDTYSVEINDGEDGNPGQDATPDLITVDYSDLTFPVVAGTMCYHSGLLYKANQAIATSEEWTEAHWTQTTIEEEHLSLKTEIMQTGAYYIDRNLFKNPTTVNSNASNVINAAIIDAQTKGLQYCVIPEGEYWITQTIYLKSDVILCGCGIDATTLKIADGCDIDAIRVAEPVNNSGLMDLAIDGNRIENYSVYVNGHHGNAINVWLHYGRIERVRTNWVFKHSLLLNYDTGNSDDGLGFAPEHQNDMGNLNKVLWCDFKDSLLQGVMWGWRTMDSWMCYTNIGSHAANLYLEGGTSRFIGNHFDGDGDNGAGPEYNVYCGDGCKAMVFENNIFENTQKENIFFRQPSYSNQTMTITIANNIIRTCSKSQNEQYANIKISGYSSSVKATEIVISDNQILNPDTNANHGYAGIHLLYCANSKVVGNTFFNVGDDEVLLDNTCENVLNDNKMSEELHSLMTEINSMPTEETGQELLAAEFHNTGLTDTAIMVLGMILNAMPQDDIATDIMHSISLECERLNAIYENWMSERSA